MNYSIQSEVHDTTGITNHPNELTLRESHKLLPQILLDQWGERIPKERLLAIGELEVCVQRVLQRNGTIGLLEGYRHIKPVDNYKSFQVK